MTQRNDADEPGSTFRRRAGPAPRDPTGSDNRIVGPAVIHEGYGCPYTDETTPVFTELMNKYGDGPVIFTQYDITNEQARKRSAKLARAIGVDGHCEGTFQSGVIELVDRKTGEVLSVMPRRDELPMFEDALAKALHVPVP